MSNIVITPAGAINDAVAACAAIELDIAYIAEQIDDRTVDMLAYELYHVDYLIGEFPLDPSNGHVFGLLLDAGNELRAAIAVVSH
jgi:hypothetical protein